MEDVSRTMRERNWIQEFLRHGKYSDDDSRTHRSFGVLN